MNTHSFSLPENNISLPPLPKSGDRGPDVCAIIQLYLGIQDELLPAQVAILQEHIRTCPNCALVQQELQQTNYLFANLPVSEPSARVDQAIRAAIAAGSNGKVVTSPRMQSDRESRPYYTHIQPPEARRRSRSIAGATFAVALTAVLLFALFTTLHFITGSTLQAFLPANLSWNGYILYHSETRITPKGQRYRIDTYHDLATDRIHVETVLLNALDVVVIGNNHEMLGLDMMHHIAQWGVAAWSVDESIFNLPQLRSDMAAKRAVYLGKDTFHDQDVYRIRSRSGLVLLLNMHYQPVNVLRGAIGSSTGEPIYNTLKLMPASHVSNSMWNMSIPPTFHMGILPSKL
ncbi:MAG: hypothetical protein NVS4B7_09070 [Ktedonobacteraceae bacterium]